MVRAMAKMRRRVELRTLRMESPTSRIFWEADMATKTRPEEVMARGPTRCQRCDLVAEDFLTQNAED